MIKEMENIAKIILLFNTKNAEPSRCLTMRGGKGGEGSFFAICDLKKRVAKKVALCYNINRRYV